MRVDAKVASNMVGGVAGNDHMRDRINVNCLSMDTKLSEEWASYAIAVGCPPAIFPPENTALTTDAWHAALNVEPNQPRKPSTFQSWDEVAES